MYCIQNYQISPIIIKLFKLQDSTYNMRDNKKFKILTFSRYQRNKK